MTKNTVNSARYSEYLKISNKLYKFLRPFYKQIFLRKLSWKRNIYQIRLKIKWFHAFSKNLVIPQDHKGRNTQKIKQKSHKGKLGIIIRRLEQDRDDKRM
jgi:hypothetical protein